MKSKTFNIYCDESSYLENDLHRYMLLGYIKCPYPLVKQYSKEMLEIMNKHNFYAELKWSNTSQAKVEFYLDIINWFWNETELKFRSIVIDKSKLKHDQFFQSHDEFYYKMYYYLLNYKIDTADTYNVYLDIKDNRSASKVSKLKDVLNYKYEVFRNIQSVPSKEVKLIQLADFLMGAIAYTNNYPDLKNLGKRTVVSLLEKSLNEGNYGLNKSNYNEKFNLFFIDLK